MITTRTFDQSGMQEAASGSQIEDDGWVHLSAPTPEESASIQKQFGLPPSHISAVLDFNERPRLESDGDTLLIILRAPVDDNKSLDKPLSTCPVAFILRGNLLVTVCLKESVSNKLLATPLKTYDERSAIMLMLSLIMRISSAYISYLTILDDTLGSVETNLQQSMHNKELLRMLHVDKSLIYYLTALKGNQTVLEKLRNGSVHNASAQERALLDDILIENKQGTDMAEIYTQIIGSIGDTFSSMVSNNLNKVMKFLTGLTIVFMVPTIIASLYGMNVPVPGEGKKYSFAVLSFLCLAITLLVYRILKKKRWM